MLSFMITYTAICVVIYYLFYCKSKKNFVIICLSFLSNKIFLFSLFISLNHFYHSDLHLKKHLILLFWKTTKSSVCICILIIHIIKKRYCVSMY